LVAALCAVALAACGRDPADLTPTSAPAATTQPSGPSLTSPTSAPAPATETPATSASPAAASPTANEITVGELAGRIAAAWGGVTTYRATFTTTALLPSAAASPVASPPARASPVAVLTMITVVDEVALPDRRHRVERAGEAITTEVIVIGDLAYVRGIDLPAATPAAGEWLVVQLSTLSPETAEALHIDGNAANPAPPYSALPVDVRSRTAHPLGAVDVGGRQCQAYRIADATLTGEPVQVVIALDARDLPCSIETTAGGVVGTTVYEFGVPVEIEPPA
jgi:hypothetical protein